MNKINVIDLDKTLISYDSFRYFFLIHLKKKNFMTPGTLYAISRKMRLVGSADFKHMSLILFRKDTQYEKKISKLVAKIISDIKPDIMECIKRETDPKTTNVLVSASPVDYVELVAKELGWPYLASNIVNGKFVHCYGLKKKELILHHYPKEKYKYNFAISDSSSDLPLLEMFNRYKLVE